MSIEKIVSPENSEKCTVSAVLDADEVAEITRLASELGVSVSHFCRAAIRQTMQMLPRNGITRTEALLDLVATGKACR